MYVPAQVNTALDLLAHAGFEAFLVGGSVRDYVRENKQGSDWDITTNALPEETKAVFQGYRLIETGLKHGTVTVVMDGEPLEITTYRIDGSYTDHRRPDSVSFTGNLRDDVERRDFTMNALAYNPKTGIVDLVGGVDDIRANLIRCVGDPDRRFQEDALRILRALRFASVLEMTIDPATAAAAHRNKALLSSVASERVQVELTKLLCGTGAAQVLREFADVIAVVLPEISPMFDFDQKNPHHDRDIWNHTVSVVSSIPPLPHLRWTALLHDIGKPHCFFTDSDGIGHFYGHAAQSTAIADTVLNRLRFDHATRDQVLLLVKHHDAPLPTEEKGIKRLMNRFGAEAALQLVEVHRADTAGLHPSCAYRYEEFDAVQAKIEQLLVEEACFSLKDLAVNGNDLIEKGLRGKQIGNTLQLLLEAVIDGTVPNERSELLNYADRILHAST